MSNDQSPWAQPDPRWQPASYHDAAGRDPRQPFGAPATPPGHTAPTIEQFREQKQPGPPWWVVAAGVLVAIALLLVGLQFISGDTDAEPSATPTAEESVPPEEQTPGSAATGGSAIPFEGNGTGYFEIVDQSWDGGGLSVTYRIALDEGQESFGFYLFNKQTMEVADPADLTPVVVNGGTPATGTVRFDVDRGDSTIVLTSVYGRALTALDIRG